MLSVSEYFESRYSGYEHFWWDVEDPYSTSPDDLAFSLLAQATLRFARDRVPGRALDIGSGEGADAIRLARLGWKVEAVELTSAGCSKIRNAARKLDVAVAVHQADIRDFQTDREFGIIICNGLLHYLREKEEICLKMQSLTSPGGANVVSLWSDYSPVPTCHSDLVEVFPDRECGEVYSTYQTWRKLLLYHERNRQNNHKDMPPHVHSYVKMLAVKEAELDGKLA